MPYYQVIVKNVSNTLFADDFSQTEYCTADSVDQADAIVRHELGRFVNVDLHAWTITEIPSLPD